MAGTVGSATVIPVSGILLGFVGQISQADLPHVKARQVNPTDALNIPFGDPCVLNTNNTYSSVATFLAASGTLTATVPLGIAVAGIQTNAVYAPNGGNDTTGGVYVPGSVADVLRQGTINVKINVGTSANAGGTVYVRVTANGSVPNGVVGEFEATSDSSHTVALTNVVFTTGIIGSDGTAQVTILNQQLP